MTKDLALAENWTTYTIITLFLLYIAYVFLDTFMNPLRKKKVKGGG
jgi:hypothetical protein